VTSSSGQNLALGDRLEVSFATAKRLPSAKDSLLSTDARTSKAFSNGHMLLNIDSYGYAKQFVQVCRIHNQSTILRDSD